MAPELPIHRACRNKFSTFQQIDALIKKYPDDVGKPDHLGRYPLHLALRFLKHDSHVGKRIIIEIAHAFPDAAQYADPLMFTPVQIALLHAKGDEELIRLLWDHAGGKDPFG